MLEGIKMKEKKTILITIIVSIVIAISIITVIIIINNNNSRNTINENGSSQTPGSSDTSNGNNTQESTGGSDAWRYEVISSDPIGEYLYSPHKTDTYTLSLSLGAYDKIEINILINTPTPETEIAKADTKIYKDQALQQIRNWGINPDNYQINVIYRY